MKENLFLDPAHELYYTDSTAYRVYLAVTISLNAVMFGVSLITLRHILKGSRSNLALKIVKNYLLFTISYIGKLLLFYPVINTINGTHPEYSWSIWICVLGSYICMIASSGTVTWIIWYFGYHYYNCGTKLGYYVR